MPSTPTIRTKSVILRRNLLKAAGGWLISTFLPGTAFAAQILAVRVWPAKDYTRVTLESDSALKKQPFYCKKPRTLSG